MIKIYPVLFLSCCTIMLSGCAAKGNNIGNMEQELHTAYDNQMLTGGDERNENPSEVPTQTNDAKTDKNKDEEKDIDAGECSILLDDTILSIQESKSSITRKLEEKGYAYEETFYNDSDDVKFDSAYSLSFDGDSFMSLCFKENSCVLIGLRGENKGADTARGLHLKSSYSDMLDLYGEPYETHKYNHKGIYKVYLYQIEDCYMEVCIPGKNAKSINSIDIYTYDQFPVYSHDEEIFD